jgi:hypothetical protein
MSECQQLVELNLSYRFFVNLTEAGKNFRVRVLGDPTTESTGS